MVSKSYTFAIFNDSKNFTSDNSFKENYVENYSDDYPKKFSSKDKCSLDKTKKSKSNKNNLLISDQTINNVILAKNNSIPHFVKGSRETDIDELFFSNNQTKSDSFHSNENQMKDIHLKKNKKHKDVSIKGNFDKEFYLNDVLNNKDNNNSDIISNLPINTLLPKVKKKKKKQHLDQIILQNFNVEHNENDNHISKSEANNNEKYVFSLNSDDNVLNNISIQNDNNVKVYKKSKVRRKSDSKSHNSEYIDDAKSLPDISKFQKKKDIELIKNSSEAYTDPSSTFLNINLNEDLALMEIKNSDLVFYDEHKNDNSLNNKETLHDTVTINNVFNLDQNKSDTSIEKNYAQDKSIGLLIYALDEINIDHLTDQQNLYTGLPSEVNIEYPKNLSNETYQADNLIADMMIKYQQEITSADDMQNKNEIDILTDINPRVKKKKKKKIKIEPLIIDNSLANNHVEEFNEIDNNRNTNINEILLDRLQEKISIVSETSDQINSIKYYSKKTSLIKKKKDISKLNSIDDNYNEDYISNADLPVPNISESNQNGPLKLINVSFPLKNDQLPCNIEANNEFKDVIKNNTKTVRKKKKNRSEPISLNQADAADALSNDTQAIGKELSVKNNYDDCNRCDGNTYAVNDINLSSSNFNCSYSACNNESSSKEPKKSSYEAIKNRNKLNTNSEIYSKNCKNNRSDSSDGLAYADTDFSSPNLTSMEMMHDSRCNNDEKVKWDDDVNSIKSRKKNKNKLHLNSDNDVILQNDSIINNMQNDYCNSDDIDCANAINLANSNQINDIGPSNYEEIKRKENANAIKIKKKKKKKVLLYTEEDIELQNIKSLDKNKNCYDSGNAQFNTDSDLRSRYLTNNDRIYNSETLNYEEIKCDESKSNISNKKKNNKLHLNAEDPPKLLNPNNINSSYHDDADIRESLHHLDSENKIKETFAKIKIHKNRKRETEIIINENSDITPQIPSDHFQSAADETNILLNSCIKEVNQVIIKVKKSKKGLKKKCAKILAESSDINDLATNTLEDACTPQVEKLDLPNEIKATADEQIEPVNWPDSDFVFKRCSKKKNKVIIDLDNEADIDLKLSNGNNVGNQSNKVSVEDSELSSEMKSTKVQKETSDKKLVLNDHNKTATVNEHEQKNLKNINLLKLSPKKFTRTSSFIFQDGFTNRRPNVLSSSFSPFFSSPTSMDMIDDLEETLPHKEVVIVKPPVRNIFSERRRSSATSVDGLKPLQLSSISFKMKDVPIDLNCKEDDRFSRYLSASKETNGRLMSDTSSVYDQRFASLPPRKYSSSLADYPIQPSHHPPRPMSVLARRHSLIRKKRASSICSDPIPEPLNINDDRPSFEEAVFSSIVLSAVVANNRPPIRRRKSSQVALNYVVGTYKPDGMKRTASLDKTVSFVQSTL